MGTKIKKVLIVKENEMALRVQKKLEMVPYHKFLRLEADGNYTVIYLANGKRIVSSRTLKYFDNKLVPNGFIRVHQSHLVNSKYVVSFSTGKYSGEMKLKDKTIIPISSRRKKTVKTCFLVKN